MPQPTGASSPTVGVPEPNRFEDTAAKADHDQTLQQNLITELQSIREKLSSMEAEDMKRARTDAVVTFTPPPVKTVEQRDKEAEMTKLREREAHLERELRELRIDPVTYYYY